MTDTGEFVLRWTAWLSLLGWAASEWERARKGSTAGKRARLLFTLGGLALVVLGSALIVVHSLRADRVELQGAIEDLPAALGPAGAPGRSEPVSDESLAAHRATTAASSALWTAEKS